MRSTIALVALAGLAFAACTPKKEAAGGRWPRRYDARRRASPPLPRRSRTLAEGWRGRDHRSPQRQRRRQHHRHLDRPGQQRRLHRPRPARLHRHTQARSPTPMSATRTARCTLRAPTDGGRLRRPLRARHGGPRPVKVAGAADGHAHAPPPYRPRRRRRPGRRCRYLDRSQRPGRLHRPGQGRQRPQTSGEITYAYTNAGTPGEDRGAVRARATMRSATCWKARAAARFRRRPS